MKTAHKLKIGLIALAALPLTLLAQDDKNIDALVEAKTYVFKANTALPQRGNSIPLTSFYTLQVSPDTVIADLPYFGRAFVAPINPADGGIKFTSTKFAYESEDGKKGRHEILIKPEDTRDTRQLRLTISENGYATLNVTSNSRDNISFYGTVSEVPRKK